MTRWKVRRSSNRLRTLHLAEQGLLESRADGRPHARKAPDAPLLVSTDALRTAVADLLYHDALRYGREDDPCLLVLTGLGRELLAYWSSRPVRRGDSAANATTDL